MCSRKWARPWRWGGSSVLPKKKITTEFKGFFFENFVELGGLAYQQK